jgi:hypothetical protein
MTFRKKYIGSTTTNNNDQILLEIVV